MGKSERESITSNLVRAQPANPTEVLPRIGFKVIPGTKISRHPEGFEVVIHRPGYAEILIRGRGELTGFEVLVNEPKARFTIESGYRFSLNHNKLLGVQHLISVGGTLSKGPISTALTFAYGAQTVHYSSWTCSQRELGIRAIVGYGADFNSSRLGVELGGELTAFEVEYASGTSRQPIGG